MSETLDTAADNYVDKLKVKGVVPPPLYTLEISLREAFAAGARWQQKVELEMEVQRRAIEEFLGSQSC